MLKIYNLFISHAWDYNSDYYNLVDLLSNYPYFNFKNYDEAILNILSYLYEKIASENYLELSEINDIKVLFSTKNNINRKNVLVALYKLRKYIEENM